MLDRLMRWPVLAQADRIVRQHQNHRPVHDGRKTHRRPQIVGEHEKGRPERTQSHERHSITNCGHPVLANAKMQVAAAVLAGLKILFSVQQRHRRRRQVRRAADEPRQMLREAVEHLAARNPAADSFGVGGKRRNPLVPTFGQLAGPHRFQLGSLRGIRLFVLGEFLFPLFPGRLAVRANSGGKMLPNFVGDEELCILRPAIDLLCQLHFLGAERGPMSAVRVGFVRRAVANDALEHNDRRLVGHLLGRVDCPLNRAEVVSVVHAQRVPAIALEPCSHIFAEGQLRVALDRDRVVIVNPQQVIQLEMPGRRSGLAGNPFHQVAVAAQHIDAVLEQLKARPVVMGCQPLGRHRKADAGSDALPQRAGRRLDSRRLAKLRVAGARAVELPKILDVFQRDRQSLLQPIVVLGYFPHAGQVQDRIQQHRRMAARQDEPIAARPHRLRRVVAQIVLPKLIGHRREGHRRARMAAVGLLDGVHAQRADRVDRQQVNAGLGFGDGHGIATAERRWVIGSRSV